MSSEIRVRQLMRPAEIEPWRWETILEQVGDLVVARVTGYRQGVCECCGEVGKIPTGLVVDREVERRVAAVIDGEDWNPNPEARVSKKRRAAKTKAARTTRKALASMCAVEGCGTELKGKARFCEAHWEELPPKVQLAIFDAPTPEVFDREVERARTILKAPEADED